MAQRPKYPECVECVFFSRRREQPICTDCGVGEHFQERFRVRKPSNNELMDMYADMEGDNE